MSFVPPSAGDGLDGYRSRAYAATLAHIGTPIDLPRAGSQLIARPVPGTSHTDASAPYPLLCCTNWEELANEFETLKGLVSLMAVIDPLRAPNPEKLRGAFPDLLRPFKRHYVVDLSADFEGARSSQHRRKVRRALRDVRVERVESPGDHAEEWLGLYAGLQERHAFFRAPSDFLEQGLRDQLSLPGLVYYRAMLGEQAVAAYLFLQQGQDAYYHLGASNERGRSVGASFALMDAGLRDAGEAGLSQLDLGSSASLKDDASDGLARFKEGWSTHTAIAHIGGRIMDREAYDELCSEAAATEFFPAYRAPHWEAGGSR